MGRLKTKQEILDMNNIGGGHWKHRRDVLKAMDWYAKQVGMGFGDWVQFNYQPHAEKGYWYNHHNDGSDEIFTTKQLFNMYLKSVKNTRGNRE